MRTDTTATDATAATALADDAVIVLGGRRFRPIGECTLEHDMWVMGHMHRSGLGLAPQPQTGEDAVAFAHRITGDLLASGRAALLIAGSLIPEGTKASDWTPALAEEIANHLNTLTEPSERAQIYGLVAGVVASIFEAGYAQAAAAATLVRRLGGDVEPPVA